MLKMNKNWYKNKKMNKRKVKKYRMQKNNYLLNFHHHLLKVRKNK